MSEVIGTGQVDETCKGAAEPTLPAQPQDSKKYSDADVDAIIDKKFAQWKAKQEEEANEAKRLAQMNAEEKARHEQEKLQSQIDELLHDKTMSEMTGIARNMLSEAKITASDDLIGQLVSENADGTKQAVESFIELFNNHVEEEVAERLKGKAPKKGQTKSSALTKEQILSVTDRTERLALIEENQGLFN